ncbi:hypothetical protein HQQ94_19920 [Shewanella sp. VB17]|uniref:hypothetical protein n=1 Tax=Shewanella sp. VB17 TaxID=2739432 RepID=UPI0015676EDF|nr:hypothetical protein [Shewanella sp. VB17]NRD75445.1 hypothetical protein [Shewanella sp. VB17]
MSKFEAFPPRVFVLVPSNSENALVIRRASASKVAVYGWNVKTNKISLSQWLKGRIYEYFSDISPDGKYFIYSANKKGEGYTVISYSPWIKAISFWRNVGGWGGGLFVNNKQYMLLDGSDSYSKFISNELKSTPRNAQILKHGIYEARLINDGWLLDSSSKGLSTYMKQLNNEASLIKVVDSTGDRCLEGKGRFWENHKIVTVTETFTETVSLEDWEWCEIINGYLCWSERGRLLQVLIDNNMNINIPQIIYNFNDEHYEEKCAPY